MPYVDVETAEGSGGEQESDQPIHACFQRSPEGNHVDPDERAGREKSPLNKKLKKRIVSFVVGGEPVRGVVQIDGFIGGPMARGEARRYVKMRARTQAEHLRIEAALNGLVP